ncbi:MAG: hypothetical protein EAZ55_03235 [Cytophagales bacterium]|nr:MAG: hypothetical protein EAZ55_03235 [Cytophagales bacterium]
MKKFLLFFGIAFMSFQVIWAQNIDFSQFRQMRMRNIGPAGMSGRVTAIDAVVANPDIIYVGTASGGLWKSESGGTAWKSIFENEKVASIGAIAIDQRNPQTLWVGTGEGNPRNSQTSGYGIYKSQDGGKTWKIMGLEKTRHIHRIIIHPENPNVIYVAAIGIAWGENEDRGVYKTTDGGQTWKKVLYVNSRTGAADMVIDPKNPNKLMVSMWEYMRQPWYFKSGGAGSGIYVTQDGGDSWEKLSDKNGLPAGELGRVGLAIARSNPQVVYAIVESNKNALYRSNDGGNTWAKTAERGFGDRPFYYSEIYVDTQNENRLYSLYSVVSMSEDGGKTFKAILPWSRQATDVHLDHHAWWIHPENANLIYDGNDGGFNISHDGGKNWRFAENIPVGQFYHINVDNAIPYNVMGGLQDNGSWHGPGYLWRQGGIRNSYFQEIFFGDGFDVIPDRSNERYVYAMSQGGNVGRVDLETGTSKLIKPIHPEGKELRFNWNAGMAHDPFNSTTIYYGSQYLHKSTDRGDNWEIISPDLTTNNPEKQKAGISGGLTYDVTGAENHTTIIAIAPSTKKEGVIWVGTDDGNVQITQDGGKTWTNVAKNIKGMPEGAWVPQIHASTHDPAEAFVVINNYRQNDWTPYLFYTKDYGKTWTRIADENKVWGYCLSVVQDPVEPKLVFLGTEYGLYVSIDYGKTWSAWKNGYPTVSTMDMVIHPTEHDLVIGTFGRGIYILDDIRPLRKLAQEGSAMLNKNLVAINAPDAYIAEVGEAYGTRFAANAIFAGQNRPFGAMLSFYLKEVKTSAENKSDTTKVTVEILEQGNVIRTIKVKPTVGLNRWIWNLDRKGPRFPNSPKPTPDSPEPSGLNVLPGSYTVRYTYGDWKDSVQVNVKLDPRLKVSIADMQAKNDLLARLEKSVKTTTDIVDRLNSSKETIEAILKQMPEKEDDALKEIKKQGKVLQDSIKAFREIITGKDDVQGIFRDSDVLTAEIGQAFWHLQSSWEKPDSGHLVLVNGVEQKLKDLITRINAFYDKDWRSFQQQVENAKISPFKTYEPIELK